VGRDDDFQFLGDVLDLFSFQGERHGPSVVDVVGANIGPASQVFSWKTPGD
jgi:hypothetical protein